MGFFEKDKPGGLYESGDGLFGYKSGPTHPLFLIGSALDGTLDMAQVQRMQEQRQKMAAAEQMFNSFGIDEKYKPFLPILGPEAFGQMVMQQDLSRQDKQWEMQKNRQIAQLLKSKGYNDLVPVAMANPQVAIELAKRREEQKEKLEPKLEAGYRWVDPSDKSKGVEPIKGKTDPVDLARRKKEAELEATVKSKQAAKDSDLVKNYDSVLYTLSKLISNDVGLRGAAGPVGGRMPNFFEESRGAKADLDELQAKLISMARAEMQGQGNISEGEQEAAARKYGNFDVTLDDDKLTKNLLRLYNQFNKDYKRITGKDYTPEPSGGQSGFSIKRVK